MTDIIGHRGPDGDGFYENDGVAFGHRRLSIIDLATGSQPMTNEDGSLWITYNGEIFNHADLRPDLERAGHRYHSRCDTETVLHAYEQYGDECVRRFRGMFAFAIWDQTNAAPVLRARPAGHQAFLLLLERPAVRLRLGDQGAAGASGDLGSARTKRCSPSIWHSATAAARRPCLPAFASSCRGIL